jgi:hypothetical protein
MPDWKEIVRKRLAGLTLEGSSESEVFDELAHHLEDRYEELLLTGVPEDGAQRMAVEPLHSSPSLIEALQRAKRTPGSGSRTATPRQPARGAALRFAHGPAWDAARKPGFSFLVIGILALGIAGNAAIFSTFNGLFLKPLPFPDSGASSISMRRSPLEPALPRHRRA